MKTNVLIIGGGLAGLSLAWQLQKRGFDYQLIEARARFGGRVDAHDIGTDTDTPTRSFDTGPAWFWPGQLRIAEAIDELGLQIFEQYALGDVIFEDEAGRTQRGRGYSSMKGSLRLKGSLQKLIEGIKMRLPSERYRLSCRATSIEQFDGGITTFVRSKDGKLESITSQKIVLALPPRVVADTLSFSPNLSDDIVTSMHSIPTWMAGHAKVVAIYDEAFWRNNGLSGDVMSHRGPLVEIHDASPESHLSQTHGPYALFGFMGVPASARVDNRQMLIDASIAQLVRLFGDKARTPLDIILQDWALEAETTTALDRIPLDHHPIYGLPSCLKSVWAGKIIFSSTEAAPEFGGYLEGAFEAAEITLQQL
ncbi:MAG: monoamine oxidase [Pseudohongiellaceae bacterium]|jgi:monoamine oxidase